MKRPLYWMLLVVLLVVSFVGGVRYSQYESGQQTLGESGRRILHYVDPMNPANTSKEPGIAPCGMPMEPVYADEDAGSSMLLGLPPGAVRVSSEKLQIIGVQTGTVASTSESAHLRVLGKVVPDENKVYSLVSGTDGWMGEIHDSTTGSIVQKDQLMGKIRIYDYDFYTWQQRYLTELGNAGRRRVYISPLSGMQKKVEQAAEIRREAGALLPDPGAPINLPSEDHSQSSGEKTTHGKTTLPTDNPHDGKQSEKMQGKLESPAPPSAWGIPPGTLYYGQGSQPTGNPDEILAEILREKEKIPDLPDGPAPELPDGPAPELPDNAVSDLPEAVGVTDIELDPSMTDSVPAAKVEPKAAHMAQSHKKVTEKTMPMPDGSTLMDKPSDATSAHDHASMSETAVPTDQNIAEKNLMTHQSPSPDLMSPAGSGENRSHQKSGRHYFSGEDDILYASKARQELLDLGVTRAQLEELADTGVYVTSVQMHSPVDGLVLSRNVTPRQKIDRGQECFRIADVSTVWVEADVFDIEERLLHPGTPAKVSLPNTGEHRMATVTGVLPYFTDNSRTLKVRLEIENKDYQFRPDMFVDVEFILQLEPAITVPSSAVIDSGKHATVYVVREKGLFEPRSVETGWRFNKRTQIIDGLAPGEQIVVSGNFLIDSESRMKLAAARLMDKGPEAAAAPVTRQITGRTLPKVMTNMSGSHKTIDPICGMNVDSTKALEADLTANFNGQTYYFCSEECLEDFHRHGPKIESTMPQHGSTTGAIDTTDPHKDHMSGNSGAMDMSTKKIFMEKQGNTQDPVCSMDVDIEHALSADLKSEYKGTTYYFCSPQCKDRFEQSPLDFVDDPMQNNSPGHEGHIHD